MTSSEVALRPERPRSTTPHRDVPLPQNALSKRITLSLLEAFFKQPVVYMLPIVALFGLGLFLGLGGSKEYRSVGVLNVTSDSPLADLTDSANVPSFGYESPATVTARQINNLLGTRELLDAIIDKARLGTTVASGQWTRDQLGASISAWASGDNLVRVASTTDVPELSQALAAATVSAFVDYIVEANTGDLALSIDVYGDQLADAQARLRDANSDLEEFLAAYPSSAPGEARPDAQLAEFNRLNSNVDNATTEVNEIQAQLDDANLTNRLTRTDVERRLNLIDEPELPAVAEPRLRKAGITAILFGAVGALIAVAAVLTAALLDRTVRIPSDVTDRFNLDVLAVLPASGR